MYSCLCHVICFFFFFNDTATPEIYSLSLHDALPISRHIVGIKPMGNGFCLVTARQVVEFGKLPELDHLARSDQRSEEHTSELQSPCNLVCRLLLEKKKNRSHSSAYDT